MPLASGCRSMLAAVVVVAVVYTTAVALFYQQQSSCDAMGATQLNRHRRCRVGNTHSYEAE